MHDASYPGAAIAATSASSKTPDVGNVGAACAPDALVHIEDAIRAKADDGEREARFQSFPERLLSLFGPERSRLFALIALELVSHPEQCAEDGGAIIAGEVHDPGLDDETAEFDQMPRALTALDLPCAHVMPRPCRLMPVARRPVAPERRPCRGQAPMQFAAPGSERTRLRAWPMPPSFRRLWFRPARSARQPVRRH